MIPTVIVFGYLAVVLYIGIFAFRHRVGEPRAEDYFLAGRTLGPAVFLMIPRRMSHTLVASKKPLVLVSIRAGEKCAS